MWLSLELKSTAQKNGLAAISKNQKKAIKRVVRVLFPSILLLGVVYWYSPEPTRRLYETIATKNMIHESFLAMNDAFEQDQVQGDDEIVRRAINIKPFNTTNPHPKFCPNALCHNSPLCSPCNRRYLFILAPGRTGSTTLLTMFNKLPGVRLSGENYGELNLAAHLSSNLEQGDPDNPNFVYDEAMPDGPFEHNAIPTGSLACVSQHLLNVLNPPPMWMMKDRAHFSDKAIERYDSKLIMGFKTVRLDEGAWTYNEAIKYLKEAFPCARFIINTGSDHDSVVRSRQKHFEYSKPTPKLLEDLKKQNEFYINMANELGPDIARLVDLDDWMNDVDVLNGIVRWLGFSNCKFNIIIHDNKDGFRSDDAHHRINLGKHCTAPQ